MAVAGVVSFPKPSDIESYERIVAQEKDQHQRLRDAETALSSFSSEYAFARKLGILENRLSINPSLSELKSILKTRLVVLSFMRQWLQCTQYAKVQYQREVEYLNKALKMLQNDTISTLAAQNKKISGIPLALRDYLSYTQMNLTDSPEKLFHKGALQPPYIYDKNPIGEILKEGSVCQRSIHEKESFAEQLQKSVQYTENEVQLIQMSIQQCGWIRRGCSALLNFLLWRP
jgi:hypothetical protein